MPPKKAAPKKSAKSERKENEKIIQDKTFGLKNKNKSKKVQQFCKSVENRVQNKTRQDIIAEQRRRDEKAQAEAEKKERERLFRPAIVQPKVPPGVDPKTVLCEFFRQNSCAKGKDCKFSHDLDILNKPANEIFEDQEKLTKSVDEKFKERNKNAKSKQVCKFFLEALDKRLFGSNWECPTKNCPFLHSIPKGWIIKRKDEPKEEVPEDEIPLEEKLDDERSELALTSSNPTLLTHDVFQEWLKTFAVKEKERIEKEKKREAPEAKSNLKVMLSGKQLLIMKPSIFVDDDDAMDEAEVERQTEEEFDSAQAMELQKTLNKDIDGLVDSKYLVDYSEFDQNLPQEDDEKEPEKEKEKEKEKETVEDEKEKEKD